MGNKTAQNSSSTTIPFWPTTRDPAQFAPPHAPHPGTADPLGTGYQNPNDLTPSRITTAEPLDLDTDSEEEGEITEKLADKTPKSHAKHPDQPPHPPAPSPITPQADDPMDGAEGDGGFAGFPTDDEFKKLKPTHQNENPHTNSPAYIPSGPDELGATAKFQVNTGEWHALVIVFLTATANTAASQVEAALEDPDHHLLIIPFLAGPHFFQRYCNAPTDITKALEGITGPNGLVIVPPTAAEKIKSDCDNKYNAPLAMFGRTASRAIHNTLLRHSTFPISKSLAVHVLPIDTDKRSWTMGLYKCNMAGNDEAIADSLCLAAAKEAKKKGPLRNIIVRATQPGATASADERIYEWARTITVVYLAHEKDPLWVMYARPPTTDFELWEEARCYTRNMRVKDRLTLFTPIRSILRGETSRPASICHLCKLDDHLSYICTYTKAVDWLGPDEVITNKTTGVLANRPEGEGCNSRNFGRGGFRGRRGHGGGRGSED
ncbi:hypothetical protein B0H10DRAFT_1956616 [Mycena sp. CBHHK59/15]|nr:hypothetical protein B0H10DRAFT_1956616 [Mycena sp. CBHHK59/15]